MNTYELNKLKRSVVTKAWLAEKLRICKGEGMRDWAVIQQDDILKYNIAVGYVAQFLNDSMNESEMKVQFVESSIDYFSAHDIRQNARKNGVIDTDNYTVTAASALPTVKLSEPSYLGYLESHRNLFVGQDVGFGLKVSAAKNKKQADSDSAKSKFGLDVKEESSDSSENDATEQRLKMFGF